MGTEKLVAFRNRTKMEIDFRLTVLTFFKTSARIISKEVRTPTYLIFEDEFTAFLRSSLQPSISHVAKFLAIFLRRQRNRFSVYHRKIVL